MCSHICLFDTVSIVMLSCMFQFNGQHLFVHIGNNVTYSDPVLEASTAPVYPLFFVDKLQLWSTC